MASNAQLGGLAAGAVGVGILGYFGYPYVIRALSGTSIVSVSFSPSPPEHGQDWSATVSAKGKAGTLLGAQGAIIQTNGVVGGHLWASQADADGSYNTYWDTYNGTPGSAAQKSAAAEAAVAALSARFDQRVTTASAGSGGTAGLALWSESLQPGSYTLAIFVKANPSALIVQDPVGTTLAALKRASAVQATFQVTVA